MSRNQVTVVVSGGNVDENRQLTTIVNACLAEKGFTNVSINHADIASLPGQGDLSICDLIRSMNPELFDTPIFVMGENDEDIFVAEREAMQSLSQMTQQHTPSTYVYN